MLPNNPLFCKADLCRYHIHLRSLKVCHLKMTKAMASKIMASRSPSMLHDLSALFHEYLPTDLNLLWGNTWADRLVI
jgi:hypothetical protein